MRINRLGLRVGPLAVTWRDGWTRKRGLEVCWNYRLLFAVGFGKPVA